MNDNPKPDSFPEPMPAPQLPNLPSSPDDPFQRDPEQPMPVTSLPDSDPAPGTQTPGRPRRPGQSDEVNPEVEPQFDNDGS